MDPAAPPLPPISPDDFFRADLRLGEIVTAEAFPQARKPAWRLTIDFGPGVGVKTSSAQITDLYPRESLPGCRVLAVINFPPRQIGPVRSEVLVLGVHDAQGRVCLLSADGDAPLGARVA
jgi:tRNA-binding protein